MNETEFAKALIKESRQEDRAVNDWKTEVHYNHYGSRGCVDLVQETKWTDDDRLSLNILELKAEPALEEVTGANEILRQFNKHTEYFFDGTTKYPQRKYEGYTFFLTFYATPRTVNHIRENAELYQQAIETGWKVSQSVGVWHESVGHLAIAHDEIWEEAIRSNKLREKLDYKMEVIGNE